MSELTPAFDRRIDDVVEALRGIDTGDVLKNQLIQLHKKVGDGSSIDIPYIQMSKDDYILSFASNRDPRVDQIYLLREDTDDPKPTDAEIALIALICRYNKNQMKSSTDFKPTVFFRSVADSLKSTILDKRVIDKIWEILD